MARELSRPVAQARPVSQPTVNEPAAGVELLDFARTLCAASSNRQLGRRFIAGFGRLFDLPMYALYLIDPWTGDELCVGSTGVSDSFLARYERGGRELNWLKTHLCASGRAVYNMDLMAMDEWLEDPLYTKLKYLHDIRHEVQAPVINRDGVIGTLHCGTNDPSRGLTPYEVRLTEALGRVVGAVIEGIQHRDYLRQERNQAVVALDRTGSAVVIIDPTDPEPRLNVAARRMLAQVVDGEHVLHQVIARPGAEQSFSRHVDVELVDGDTGLLHGHSSYTRAETSTLITMLELQRDQAEISAQTLTALTPRERDVALLVVDGLSDRQIADRLYLSHHTVSQYVKRIYRKLDVPSRIALTRLLLDLRNSNGHS
ncbi:MAG TPA: helix-turn-helix transcriptional regulator [Jiangellaceae bacterium]|nr:helix-turn-helix transcriptional regulator [Jiangellaceae bacterium]